MERYMKTVSVEVYAHTSNDADALIDQRLSGCLEIGSVEIVGTWHDDREPSERQLGRMANHGSDIDTERDQNRVSGRRVQ